mmetsp:Transcript_4236/g.13677  ORF Transcript_4236/g.13677 Transcript_4236/m.13677 type:complete len:300 (-) Transcript_4236:86-985(-)
MEASGTTVTNMVASRKSHVVTHCHGSTPEKSTLNKLSCSSSRCTPDGHRTLSTAPEVAAICAKLMASLSLVEPGTGRPPRREESAKTSNVSVAVRRLWDLPSSPPLVATVLFRCQCRSAGRPAPLPASTDERRSSLRAEGAGARACTMCLLSASTTLNTPPKCALPSIGLCITACALGVITGKLQALPTLPVLALRPLVPAMLTGPALAPAPAAAAPHPTSLRLASSISRTSAVRSLSRCRALARRQPVHMATPTTTKSAAKPPLRVSAIDTVSPPLHSLQPPSTPRRHPFLHSSQRAP